LGRDKSEGDHVVKKWKYAFLIVVGAFSFATVESEASVDQTAADGVTSGVLIYNLASPQETMAVVLQENNAELYSCQTVFDPQIKDSNAIIDFLNEQCTSQRNVGGAGVNFSVYVQITSTGARYIFSQTGTSHYADYPDYPGSILTDADTFTFNASDAAKLDELNARITHLAKGDDPTVDTQHLVFDIVAEATNLSLPPIVGQVIQIPLPNN
jgi:hypothetical protein